MMETQKILKPSNKIVILADYREKEVIDHLRKLNANVNEMKLEVGDFVCSANGISIERKTHSDFIASIIDGRIFEQLKLMKENYHRPILIVEGYSNREINENALKATMATLITKFNTTFINTKNSFDTARMIFWIAKKEQEDFKQSLGFKQGKKPKDIKKLQEFILSSIPGVSTILAKRLLEHFGNIESVIVAKESDLIKVRGVGSRLAKKIKKLLITKYI